MKRLACLVIVLASAMPCPADDPNEPDTRQNVKAAPKIQGPNWFWPGPPKMLDDKSVRTILFPLPTIGREVIRQIGLDRWPRHNFDPELRVRGPDSVRLRPK